MKIHEKKPADVIRLTISSDGQRKNITFVKVSQDHAINKVSKLLKASFKNDQSGTCSRLDFRECKAGVNGKSKRVLFFGATAAEIEKVLILKFS